MNKITEHYQEQIAAMPAEAFATKPFNAQPLTLNPQPATRNSELDRFIATVRLMRNAQKDYFRTRNSGALMLAKGYEKDVDAYLEDFLKATQPGPRNAQDSFDEDKIGELIQQKVRIMGKIQEYEDRLRNMTNHESDAAIAIHDNINDLRYDLELVTNNLIHQKEEFKLFLQTRLTRFKHQLDNPQLSPSQQEELSHDINIAVRKIGELDIEIKRLKTGTA